jgi:hypothetical protein
MKTKTFIACLATGLLTLGKPARAASNPAATHSHTASFESRHHARQTAWPAVLSQPGVSGVIPRAIRGGNPLQMLNPFAPAKYGAAGRQCFVRSRCPRKSERNQLLQRFFLAAATLQPNE